MANGESGERDYRLKGLSYFQTGIVFVVMATLLIVYVAYQIDIGRVFTKSGEMRLGPGMPWVWLALESYAAFVGAVRGIRMIRR